jgi:23S rRNA (cytidine1920-2'-O)/16S rRNA (cytidine1409-2'-O)-methyltransferase
MVNGKWQPFEISHLPFPMTHLPFFSAFCLLVFAMGRANHEKLRLDDLLVARGLANSRESAQGIILAGEVLVDEQKVEKCGARIAQGVSLRLLSKASPFVSRAGLKLSDALDHFRVEVNGKTCLDIGASTGGFTDCLLKSGAAKVFAVDAGTNQLDWKLRSNPLVVVLENTNARYLDYAALGSRVELVTIDVSFISATMILPVLPALLEPRAEVLVLVKPQFEVRREQVGKGGLVSDPRLHQQAVTRVSRKLLELGFEGLASVESSLPGASGNREFFLHALWRKAG